MRESWLNSANEALSSALIVLIPLSFVAGYFSRSFMPSLKWTAPHMLFTIMFTSVWTLTFKDFAQVKNYGRIFLFGMTGQFVLLPLVAFAIASLFYGVGADYGVGHLCVAASPAAISTIIWSSITGGDIVLAIVLVGIHVLAIPFFAPFMLRLFLGKSVHFSLMALFVKLMWSVFIPTVLAVVLYEFFPKRELKPAFAIWAKLGMLYMIVLNTSVAFSSVPLTLSTFKVFFSVGLQVVLSYVMGALVGFLTGANRKQRITLSYFMGMKNNGAALVMALSGFSLGATLPVALTIMWQQPMASVFDRIWRRKGS